jgi:hypothetical protein
VIAKIVLFLHRVHHRADLHFQLKRATGGNDELNSRRITLQTTHRLNAIPAVVPIENSREHRGQPLSQSRSSQCAGSQGDRDCSFEDGFDCHGGELPRRLGRHWISFPRNALNESKSVNTLMALVQRGPRGTECVAGQR